MKFSHPNEKIFKKVLTNTTYNVRIFLVKRFTNKNQAVENVNNSQKISGRSRAFFKWGAPLVRYFNAHINLY